MIFKFSGVLMSNNVYKIDIHNYMISLLDVKFFLEKNDISEINLKIKKEIVKNSFNNLFSLNEFLISREKIDRLIVCVQNALFERNQKFYFSKFTDILAVFYACNYIQNNKSQFFEYLNSLESLNPDFINKIKTFYDKKNHVYKSELNKITFYMKRKLLNKIN